MNDLQYQLLVVCKDVFAKLVFSTIVYLQLVGLHGFVSSCRQFNADARSLHGIPTFFVGVKYWNPWG